MEIIKLVPARHCAGQGLGLFSEEKLNEGGGLPEESYPSFLRACNFTLHFGLDVGVGFIFPT